MTWKWHYSVTLYWLYFSSTRVGNKYHLAHRTYTRELEQRETLYIAVPEQYTIIKVLDLDAPRDIDR